MNLHCGYEMLVEDAAVAGNWMLSLAFGWSKHYASHLS
jgi:hypothetical protein